MSVIQKVILAITIIGGINWALIGIFDFNLVTFIFMDNTTIARVVYTIIGLCAITNIALLFMHNRHHIEEM